ncbi:hypothetical protein ABZ419_09820 [Streptomyces cinnamoneus]|uniref:hypothetical protein n=1 Tax=Streptomyces cinnamoneus TaxID=53446 RepID=UPI0033E424C8
MSTTFKKTSGVSFTKESDSMVELDLRAQVRHLERRLFAVAFERDQLAAVVTSKREVIDRLSKERDRRDTELIKLKHALRQQLGYMVKVGEIDAEAANLVLVALDLPLFERKYRVSFEVTVEDFGIDDVLRAEDVRELLEQVAEEDDSPLSGAEWGALAVDSVGVF